METIALPLSLSILAFIFSAIAQYYFRQAKHYKSLYENEKKENHLIRQKLLNRRRR